MTWKQGWQQEYLRKETQADRDAIATVDVIYRVKVLCDRVVDGAYLYIEVYKEDPDVILKVISSTAEYRFTFLWICTATENVKQTITGIKDKVLYMRTLHAIDQLEDWRKGGGYVN